MCNSLLCKHMEPTTKGVGARRACAPIQSYNICRIYKKAQMIKDMSVTALCKVYRVSPDSTTHKLIDFIRVSGEFLTQSLQLFDGAALTYNML